MFQISGMFLLFGGFMVVVTLVSIFYQLSTGKTWGPIPVSRESNPVYYWVSVAGSFMALVFAFFWLNTVGNIFSFIGLSSTTGPTLGDEVPNEVPAGDDAFSNECPLSDDTTYGYTEANPIKIGGGSFAGADRIRRYWEVLLTTEDQPINYLPLGRGVISQAMGYSITSNGREVAHLYVDFENWETLRAPMGFICNGPFGIFAP